MLLGDEPVLTARGGMVEHALLREHDELMAVLMSACAEPLASIASERSIACSAKSAIPLDQVWESGRMQRREHIVGRRIRGCAQERERMDIIRFAEDRQDVFWIVGAGQVERHATVMRPGAVYAGQHVPALCDVQVKIPQSTPLGREPQTKSVTRKCPECERVTTSDNFSETTWDF